MKRIVLNKHDETVGVNKIKGGDYVGVLWRDKKHFIMRKAPRKYIFVVFGQTDISECTEYNNPQEIIHIINERETFVFETREELLSWLKQD